MLLAATLFSGLTLSAISALTGSATPLGTTAQTGNGILTESGPICDVTSFGADPSFRRDSTAAINSAITACVGIKGITFFPLGTYKVIPATADNGSVAATGAFPMASNMHIRRSKAFRRDSGNVAEEIHRENAVFQGSQY